MSSDASVISIASDSETDADTEAKVSTSIFDRKNTRAWAAFLETRLPKVHSSILITPASVCLHDPDGDPAMHIQAAQLALFRVWCLAWKSDCASAARQQPVTGFQIPFTVARAGIVSMLSSFDANGHDDERPSRSSHDQFVRTSARPVVPNTLALVGLFIAGLLAADDAQGQGHDDSRLPPHEMYESAMSCFHVDQKKFKQAEAMGAKNMRSLMYGMLTDDNINEWITCLQRRKAGGDADEKPCVIIKSRTPVPVKTETGVARLDFDFMSKFKSEVPKGTLPYHMLATRNVHGNDDTRLSILATLVYSISPDEFDHVPGEHQQQPWDGQIHKWTQVLRDHVLHRRADASDRVIFSFVVHWGEHWTTLALVSKHSEDKKLRILWRHIDSMGARNSHVAEQYVVSPIRSLFASVFADELVSFESAVAKSSQAYTVTEFERQPDGISCGVFVCAALMECANNNASFVVLPELTAENGWVSQRMNQFMPLSRARIQASAMDAFAAHGPSQAWEQKSSSVGDTSVRNALKTMRAFMAANMLRVIGRSQPPPPS